MASRSKRLFGGAGGKWIFLSASDSYSDGHRAHLLATCERRGNIRT